MPPRAARATQLRVVPILLVVFVTFITGALLLANSQSSGRDAARGLLRERLPPDHSTKHSGSEPAKSGAASGRPPDAPAAEHSAPQVIHTESPVVKQAESIASEAEPAPNDSTPPEEPAAPVEQKDPPPAAPQEDPAEPSDGKQPADPPPTASAQAADEAQPTNPSVPESPAEPAEPVAPALTVTPALATDPAAPADPVATVNPAVPADPAPPAEPAVPDEPAAPAQPTLLAEPLQPAASDAPAEPAICAEVADPTLVSAESTEPAGTASDGSPGDLPQREDAKCSLCGGDAGSKAKKARAVLRCRQAVARRAAAAACSQLESNPPSPPFAKAQLKVSGYLPAAERRSGVDSIPIAVEPENDIVSGTIIGSGSFEFHNVGTVLKSLHTAENLTGAPHTFLDIGANVGLFTFVAAAAGYDVLAFEAMPRNVQALRQTLCWNPDLAERVTVFPYGLGDAEATCRVMSLPENVADGNVVCTDDQLEAYKSRMKQRGVTHIVRLEDYVDTLNIRVMKIDIEGYEPRALAAAGSSLDHLLFTLSEVNAEELPRKMGAAADELVPAYLNWWTERGFDIRMCTERSSCFSSTPTDVPTTAAKILAAGNMNVLLERRVDTLPEGSLRQRGH